jgi:hypothetical protein
MKLKAATRSKPQPAPVAKRGKLSEAIADKIREKANRVLGKQ